ncbi:MAG: DUF1294 domain-containing protein [Oscillospiraceae bacterium]|jgi:predicted MPP superfamily phosphohydrolase|nr:DUF1294 domain-containing protein [Oscillospiraceae bacterium]
MKYLPLLYLAAVSLLAVFVTIHDKKAARKHTRRVRERTLWVLALLGGSAALLVTMLATRHKTRHAKFMVGIPLLLLAQIVSLTLALNTSLSVRPFVIESDKLGGEIKLVLVTDLHACAYGSGQTKLLRAIDQEQPDALVLCGDIFDSDLPPDNTTTFVTAVAAKYPCYYVSGNHEFWSGQADAFKDILRTHGVKVLEGTSEVLSVRGSHIRLCGLDDPDVDHFATRAHPYAQQLNALAAAVQPAEFTVLLSHRPERMNEFLPLKPDLVLAGHAHGGQWRVPFVLENGLLAPNQGLFPKYTNGSYVWDNTQLIVSRGLARESTPVPRIFNRPEIITITLTPPQR